jgi:Zn-dependent metalloprotease
MKKIRLAFCSAFATVTMFSSAMAQENFHGNLQGAAIVSSSKYTGLPNFVRMPAGSSVVSPENFAGWLQQSFALAPGVSFRPYSTEADRFGMTHIRYREYIGETPVEFTMIIAHVKDGKVISFNGDYYQDLATSSSASIDETKALSSALASVHAQKYKWENPQSEAAAKERFHNPAFTYFPKGELVFVHKDGNDYSAASVRLAWKFNVYAELPLSRANIYVDAQTGEVIAKQNLIHDADVVGTANTVYSGTVTMTSDNYTAGQYRLQETGRGGGIQTYNCGNTTNYTNTDFTNNSQNWNLANSDQAATDAHWGAEMTYDYYNNVHGRNSIDNAGMPLVSYVHYDVNFANAFWDGQEMTYGDGNVSQGFSIMTGLDVCGHEITHGLTTFTANLNGGEADALNEGASDIFGTTIEQFARPSQWDWIMGADITTNGSGIRTMSDPHASAYPGPQPNTYLGQYWDNTGEPHANNGPFIYWYYLLCQGGSGTNDNGDSYSITGITMAEAQLIAFRGLTVYFTSSTAYQDARTYMIQAALDIYGACSPEVAATTDAWYAVGVGPAYSSAVVSSFTSSVTSACTLPVTVNFSNTSSNATNATWYFGDNTTSTQFNASHTYTQAGTYDISLAVNSSCGTDSITQVGYLVINPPSLPTATGDSSCSSASFTLNGTGSGVLAWYIQASGGNPVYTGNPFVTPVLNSTTTYYVSNTVPQPPGYVGPASYNFGTGGQHNNSSTQYLEFDVYSNCTLLTADVNAGAAGNRTFALWDSQGNLISNYVVNIPGSGVQTVTLNIPLTPGSYRIGGTQMNLYRNNSGPSYPYTLNGAVSITGSSAGPGYYYYLYNWQIGLPACESPRIPVTCAVGPLMVSFTTAAFDTVCLSDGAFALSGGSPAGGTYSGPGVSGGTFDPAVAGNGTHTLIYTYTSGNCTATIPATVVVDDCAGIAAGAAANSFDVYPNPAGSELNIALSLDQPEDVQIRLFDLTGRIVYAYTKESVRGETTLRVSTASFPRGLYLLEVKTAAGKQVKKVELQ